jgi:hypothetical protein
VQKAHTVINYLLANRLDLSPELCELVPQRPFLDVFERFLVISFLNNSYDGLFIRGHEEFVSFLQIEFGPYVLLASIQYALSLCDFVIFQIGKLVIQQEAEFDLAVIQSLEV